jgi:hypothetical protein
MKAQHKGILLLFAFLLIPLAVTPVAAQVKSPPAGDNDQNKYALLEERGLINTGAWRLVQRHRESTVRLDAGSIAGLEGGSLGIGTSRIVAISFSDFGLFVVEYSGRLYGGTKWASQPHLASEATQRVFAFIPAIRIPFTVDLNGYYATDLDATGGAIAPAIGIPFGAGKVLLNPNVGWTWSINDPNDLAPTGLRIGLRATF